MKRVLYIVIIMSMAAVVYCRPLDGWAWMSIINSGGGVPVAAGGATDYCASSTTCGSPPGNCEVRCEDYDTGTTACVTSGDEVCFSTYGVTTNGSYDFTTITSGANYPTCFNNTNVFSISVADGQYGVSSWNAGADKPVTYLSFYYNPAVLGAGWANGENIKIGYLTTNGGDETVTLQLTNVSGTYYIVLQYWNGASTTTAAAGSTALSANTWYRIDIAANATADTLSVAVDGVDQGWSITDYSVAGTERNPRKWYWGDAAGAPGTTTQEWDNLSWSTTGQPTGCP